MGMLHQASIVDYQGNNSEQITTKKRKTEDPMKFVFYIALFAASVWFATGSPLPSAEKFYATRYNVSDDHVHVNKKPKNCDWDMVSGW